MNMNIMVKGIVVSFKMHISPILSTRFLLVEDQLMKHVFVNFIGYDYLRRKYRYIL